MHVGLLDPKDGKYYTKNMNLIATANLVDNFDQLVRRAITDDLKIASPESATEPDRDCIAAYIDALDTAVLQFATTSDIVGRRQECAAIKELIYNEGALVLVHGGMSVGVEKLMDKVIRDVQAAESAPLSTKAGTRVRGQRPVKIVRFNHFSVDSFHQSVQLKYLELHIPPGDRVKMILGGLPVMLPVPERYISTSDMAMATSCIPALWEAAVEADVRVVLVLDDAHNFLQTDEDTVEDTKELFNTLLKYTKPKSHMSAVLLSSDPAVASKLDYLGLHASQLQSTLVVGEASPAEMLAQLQELGVGKHLRELLVRVYGGHLWQISVALSFLRRPPKQDGRVLDLRVLAMRSINDAVTRWEQAWGGRKEVVSVLEEVARSGFCPFAADADDKRVRALTERAVCLFLAEDAEEYFIDPAVRQGRSGLAASTQLVRVLIPVVLKELDALPVRKNRQRPPQRR